MRIPAASALALLALGCRSSPAAPVAEAVPGPTAAVQGAPAPAASQPAATAPAPPLAQELPAGWSTVPLEEFGALLERAFPAAERRTLVPSAFEELSSALRGEDPLALRALALLAHCSDPLAGEILLQRLERRGKPAPDADLGAAIDIAAATALAGLGGVRNAGPRLEGLATGRRPHPDLEVRVVCACSALRLERERTIPFLLAILKNGTRLSSASSAWTPIADMSFCQERAAQALCERAGRPCRYRPLQALDERESDIRALEAELARRRP